MTTPSKRLTQPTAISATAAYLRPRNRHGLLPASGHALPLPCSRWTLPRRSISPSCALAVAGHFSYRRVAWEM